MKQSSTFIFIIFMLFGFIPLSGASLPKPLQSSSQDTISGKWLGELEIPNTANLRMGIIITKFTDTSYKAVLNIIDQATGDIPCDQVSKRNDSIIIRINKLGIEIAGVVVPGDKTIESRFTFTSASQTLVCFAAPNLPSLHRLSTVCFLLSQSQRTSPNYRPPPDHARVF